MGLLLFERQRDERAALQGRIVLAQHRDIYDPETGRNYAIRRYAQEQHSQVTAAVQSRAYACSRSTLPMRPLSSIMYPRMTARHRHIPGSPRYP